MNYLPREAGLRGALAPKPIAMSPLHFYMRGQTLPQAPRAFDYSNRVTDYPVALNDQLGNCTIAGVVHLLQLAYAEIGETFTYPGDAAVEQAYFDLSGGADSGLVETDVLRKWMSGGGLFNTQLAGFASVDIKNHDELASAIWLFGAVYLGHNMPPSAEQDFEQHKPWTLDNPIQTPVGGHCTVATGANSFGIDLITWGAVQSASWDWWDTYGTEAHVVIPQVFVEIDHGPIYSINILQLQADLQIL